MVSRRTKITGSPRSAHSWASSAENTALPTAAPGEAFRPEAIAVAPPPAAMTFLNNSSSRSASRRSRAVVNLDQALAAMSWAMIHSAKAVRFPIRVWSSHSLPCSTVNSISHMSR